MFKHSFGKQISNSNTHALVIGGSMAGLLAARVLVDYFDRVTIVDRDRFPDRPLPRKGIPQSTHSHILLLKGQRILEQLFPGFDTELSTAEAPSVDWTLDCPMLSIKGWEPRFPSGLITRTCSRNLLEWIVRRQLSAYNNVSFLEECFVTELLSNDKNTTVTGVRVNFGNHSELETKEVYANLVIDASGRRSNAKKWLQALNYNSPQEIIINSFLGYASRVYQRPTNLLTDWKGLIIWQKPPDLTKGGMLYPIEGNRWMVTLAGVEKDYPPTNEEGFLEFARNLRSPIIYETIENAQPLSPIYGYRATENRLRQYDKLSKWPEQFCIIGDAVCAFNPIYGQGMTTCALSALALKQCLNQQYQHRFSKNLTGFSQRFQKQLVKVYATPWMMATSEDFRWSTTEGGQPNLITKVMHWYLNRIRLLTNSNPKIFQTFIEVLHMIEPPTALFAPSNVLSVLIATIQSLRGENPDPIDLNISNLPQPSVEEVLSN